MSINADHNVRPEYDKVTQDIADYVLNYKVDSTEAIDTARNCLIDSLGCGLLALKYKECTKHLGPLFGNIKFPKGSRVPGTNFSLDPIKIRFGSLFRCIKHYLIQSTKLKRP